MNIQELELSTELDTLIIQTWRNHLPTANLICSLSFIFRSVMISLLKSSLILFSGGGACLLNAIFTSRNWSSSVFPAALDWNPQVTGASPSQASYGYWGSWGDPFLGRAATIPSEWGAHFSFCTCSLLWVSSQYGGFWVVSQVQSATMRVSCALNLSGDRPMSWKKWEPSQKGCFLLWPHAYYL